MESETMKAIRIFGFFLLIMQASATNAAPTLKPIRRCVDFYCDPTTGKMNHSAPVCISSTGGYIQHGCVKDPYNKKFEYVGWRVSPMVVVDAGYNPLDVYKRPKATGKADPKSNNAYTPPAPCYADEHQDFLVEFDSSGKPKLKIKVGGSKPGSFKWVEEKKGMNSSLRSIEGTGQTETVYSHGGAEYTVVAPIPSSYSKEGIRIQDGKKKEVLLYNDKNGCHVGREYDTETKLVKWDLDYCKKVKKLSNTAKECADLGGKISELVNRINENIKNDAKEVNYHLDIDLDGISAGKNGFEGLMKSGAMCNAHPERDVEDAAVANPNTGL